MSSITSSALSQALRADLEPFLSDFDQKEAWPDISPRELACHSLYHNLTKKLVEDVSADADSEALKKFLHCNSACKNWILDPQSSLDELLIGQLRKRLDDFFHPRGEPLVTHLYDLFDRGRCGPGASRGSRGTSFYAKMYAGPMTVTSQFLYDQYARWTELDPICDTAEYNRISHYGDCTIVEGSRLSFVPKNTTISRCICVEPTLNMYAQLGLESILLDRLKKVYRISLIDQADVNGELARVGSRNDSLATIDLSSASDSVSLKMLREFLPRDILDWLVLIRSPFVEIDGEQHELYMISSMGNGSTFPLETIIFSCVVAAVYDIFDIPLVARPKKMKGISQEINFGVFGDDIICNSSVARHVIRLLELLGFSPNQQKTFVEGPFRESCGHDFFRGHDVRPVFIDSLEHQGSRYATINNLNRWSARQKIPLTNLVQLLLTSVRWNPVPLDENDDAGVKVPLGLLDNVKRNKNGSICYRRYVVVSKSYSIADRIRAPKGFKELEYNPYGLWLSFLKGSVVSGKISVRLHDIVYRAKHRVTPNWDNMGSTPSDKLGYDRAQLATAVYFNLYG